MTLHTPPTTIPNSTSAISQLLLTQFWPNFKGRFLGSITTTTTTTKQLSWILAQLKSIQGVPKQARHGRMRQRAYPLFCWLIRNCTKLNKSERNEHILTCTNLFQIGVVATNYLQQVITWFTKLYCFIFVWAESESLR